MKKFWIPLSIITLLLCTGAKDAGRIVAPDHLYLTDNGTSLLLSNRTGNELLKLTPQGEIVQRAKLAAPANALTHDSEGVLWIVCGGNNGTMYALDARTLSVQSETQSGATPSDILYNPLSRSLWVTQRFNNEVWEVSPDTRKTVSKISVGREPVAMIPFAGDSCLLIANNQPEMAATAYPVAAQLDIVDVIAKKVSARIMLPNGATDVKDIAADRDGRYAYVTHLIARYQLPTNQLDRGWMMTNSLSIIDLKERRWLTSVILDTPQKGAANPWEVTVTPDNRHIVVAASGSQELVTIDRTALHQRLERAQRGEQVTPSFKSWENIPNDAGFLYGIREFVPTQGKGVRSVVAAADGTVYTANYYTSELVVYNLKTRQTGKHTLGAPLTGTPEGKGEMYFHDATLCFQTWQSCASCHPNDARTDGMNWDLLNDGMGNPKNTKTLLYAHRTPPCMVTGIRKDAETAVRSGVKYILFAAESEEVSSAINEYLKSLRPLPSPYLVKGELSKKARKGKQVFQEYCASCHSGELYTDRQQYPVGWAEGTEKGKPMDVPALTECWRTAPYLYDGRAATMKEMLQIHGPQKQVSEKEMEELEEYVLSL